MKRPENRSVTLRDIAAKTGFSVNTVSHALKDREDISEQTKRVIRDAAEKLGYIGNASASFLRSGISRTIAIIVGDISNPHFSIMVKEIEMEMRKLGYTSFVLNTDENEQLEKDAIIAALSKNVDGLIICPTPKGAENIRFLLGRNVPFVLIGRRFPELEASYVVCDDENGGYEAAKHLLELGHREILFLNGPSRISSARERLHGYRRALREFDVPLQEKLVWEIPITMSKSSSRLEKLLKAGGFTAVIAFSDMIAWEIVYTLESFGISVPEQVSVVGFDNIQSRFRFPVRLTTVTSSKEKMSRRAVEILLRHIGERSGSQEQVILRTRLIRRNTTAEQR